MAELNAAFSASPSLSHFELNRVILVINLSTGKTTSNLFI